MKPVADLDLQKEWGLNYWGTSTLILRNETLPVQNYIM
jgi:hypothetical protein